MRRLLLSPVLALALAGGIAAAGPPDPPAPPAPAPPGLSVSVPESVTLRPGRLKLIRAKSSEFLVRWVNLDEDELDVIPQSTTAGVIVSAATPGKYRVMAIVASGGNTAYAICTVTVQGKPPPAPPGPVPPGPTPVPPAPPAPQTPLAMSLQAAYGAELAPDKAQALKALAELYRQAVALAKKPEIMTWGKLFAAVAEAAKSLGLVARLPAMQGVIQAELRKVMPLSSGLKLDAAGREAAARKFLEVALALESVK